MNQSVTIPIRPYQPSILVKVGDKIGISKKSFIRRLKSIKTREMVSRMKGKKFKPIFVVTSVSAHFPNQFNFNMKPYNF